jgi:hypothetical protein
MKYALLIYGAPEADLQTPARWIEYTRSLKTAGGLVGAERLQPTDTATTVRLRGGERLVTDGPFVETKEHLFGFYLVEAPNLDQALDWAARMPHVAQGTVEVRPVQPIPHIERIVLQ